MTTTTEKTSKIYRTWLERLEGGVLSQSLCRQFAASITRQVMGYEKRGFKSAVTLAEARDLYQKIREQGGVRIPADAEAYGLDWLKRRGVKALEMPAEAITLFSHFTYNGGVYVDERLSLPIWHIHLTDGRILSYYWGAWQEMAYGSADRIGGWRWVTGSGFFPSENGFALTR